MKIALFGTNQLQFSKVYTPEVLKKLGEYGILSEKINQQNDSITFLTCSILKHYGIMFAFLKAKVLLLSRL